MIQRYILIKFILFTFLSYYSYASSYRYEELSFNRKEVTCSYSDCNCRYFINLKNYTKPNTILNISLRLKTKQYNNIYNKISYAVSDNLETVSLDKSKWSYLAYSSNEAVYFFYVEIPNNQNYFIFNTGYSYSTSYLMVSLSTINTVKDDSSEKKASEIMWNIITILMVVCCCVLCCICFKCYKCDDGSSSSITTHFIFKGDRLVFM